MPKHPGLSGLAGLFATELLCYFLVVKKRVKAKSCHFPRASLSLMRDAFCLIRGTLSLERLKTISLVVTMFSLICPFISLLVSSPSNPPLLQSFTQHFYMRLFLPLLPLRSLFVHLPPSHKRKKKLLHLHLSSAAVFSFMVPCYQHHTVGSCACYDGGPQMPGGAIAGKLP